VSARVVVAVVLVVAGVAAAAGLVAGPRPGGGDPAVVVAGERGHQLASSPSPTGTRSTGPR
jgi:hypothetical protein